MSKNYARANTITRKANSLFMCLKMLNKDKKTPYHIRCKCAGYVEDSIDRSEPHPLSVHMKGNLVIVESWDDYIAAIGRSGTHVDENMLWAASKYLGRDLVILEEGPTVRRYIYTSKPNPEGWVLSPFYLDNPVTIVRYNQFCYKLGLKEDPTKIQALFRGWRVRRELGQLRMAATKIQAHFRRWKARQVPVTPVRSPCIRSPPRMKLMRNRALLEQHGYTIGRRGMRYHITSPDNRVFHSVKTALRHLRGTPVERMDQAVELLLELSHEASEPSQAEASELSQAESSESSQTSEFESSESSEASEASEASEMSMEDQINALRCFDDKVAFLRQQGFRVDRRPRGKSKSFQYFIQREEGQVFRSIRSTLDFLLGKVPQNSKFQIGEDLMCQYPDKQHHCVIKSIYPDGDYEVVFEDGVMSKVPAKTLKRKRNDTHQILKKPRLIQKYSTI